MKKIRQLILLIIFIFLSGYAKGQVERVLVETYYVSDSLDATDTIGGFLESGSKTYRIFIELKEGSKLKQIYGDANHALKFESSEIIFNNKADGQTFGKDFSKNRLGENTVALDSWLTIGQTTRIAAKTYFGVPKAQDRDGSFIGGIMNDGGSAEVPGGLLVNDDSEAGLQLPVADGMDTMNSLPNSWADVGFIDALSGVDSTIFGSVQAGKIFFSNNASLQNSGVGGVNPDSNLVLIGQITTKGLLSFELNVVVEEPASPNPVLVKYVSALAPGETNSDTLKISPFLKYPAACGCADPNYLEYDAAYSCNNSDSCRTQIIYGCMDTSACNFDAGANFHIQNLCCYPGNCNDRDLGVVCPALNGERGKLNELIIFPNPAGNELALQLNLTEESNSRVQIFNQLGELVLEKDLGIVSGAIEQVIDLTMFPAGLYLLRLSLDNDSKTIQFIRK
ncbi:MAG: T9SS type A sorting domain-containing protein [Bacteroidia bacterium]|nr:T9SS type A sorting domain-containing protein [Bacteroidia bacterium]